MTMNPPHTYQGSDAVQLALGGIAVGVVAFVVGLVVVFVLIAAFWWGHHLRAGQGPPPLPSEQPEPPDHPTHLEENVECSDKFPPDGERLMPYELGGHGAEAYQPPGEPEGGPEDSPGNRTSGG
jgi:hypothetical protein